MGVQKSKVFSSNYKKKNLSFIKKLLNCAYKKKIKKKYLFFLKKEFY